MEIKRIQSNDVQFWQSCTPKGEVDWLWRQSPGGSEVHGTAKGVPWASVLPSWAGQLRAAGLREGLHEEHVQIKVAQSMEPLPVLQFVIPAGEEGWTQECREFHGLQFLLQPWPSRYASEIHFLILITLNSNNSNTHTHAHCWFFSGGVSNI